MSMGTKNTKRRDNRPAAEKITLFHGDGMKKSYDFIKDTFLKKFSSPILDEMTDAANIGDYVFTCDSFTVTPIYFPGSDIGKLSVYGTINDICVSAGLPLYLSLAIIVEEGFPKEDLEKITDSINEARKISGAQIVSGDFKVVGKGKADKIFITTSGIGKKINKTGPGVKKIREKDKIIVTGGIGEHGIAVMLSRNKIFDFDIKSDCQSLKEPLVPLWERFPGIKFMRDPTRGGIASALNEISLNCGLGAVIDEEKIPLKEAVKAACEILGIDPYYLACEGRAVIVAAKEDTAGIIKFLRANKCPEARVIGEFSSKTNKVIVNTVAGGKRILDFSYFSNLPRIC